MTEKRSKIDIFKELTWNDIQKWAGNTIVSRGRGYQRNRQVQELARTTSGGVLAWVEGTRRYATLVDVEGRDLTSACTCPYVGTCKHAVAVAVEYLEHLKQGLEVPTVTEEDRRLVLLEETPVLSKVEGTEEVWDDEDAEEEDREESRSAPRQSGKAAPDALRSYLEQQTKAQLITLLEELAERYSVVQKALQDRHDLSMGTVAQLVNAVRQEIERLSDEPGWRNSWSGEGYTPNYSRVQDRLEVLLAQGHADEVVTLGKELLEAGTSQLEMSQDEGETGAKISDPLNRCSGLWKQSCKMSTTFAREPKYSGSKNTQS